MSTSTNATALNRRQFLAAAGLTLASLATRGAAAQRAKRKQPNILFIMVDDLGKEWVRCYGSEHKLTPNVDRLAASGMLFDNAYSMPQCTPTRATLLSGQYPYRTGWINHWDEL